MPGGDVEWLEGRAGRAARTRADPVVRRALLPGVVALLVVALVGGLAFAGHTSRTRRGGIDEVPPPVPPDWRYESYAGVQVQVPPTWGWGAAPVRDDRFAGHLAGCGTSRAAVRPPDGRADVPALTPFVGRPSTVTGPCVPWGDGVLPSSDAVWFASPLPVGVSDLGPVGAETRSVGGQRVTVFSHDRALRQRILSTARPVEVDGNGCPTAPVVQSTRGPRRLDPVSLSVCVYTQGSDGAALLYSERLPQMLALYYERSVAQAPVARPAPCAPVPSGPWVALGLTDTRSGRTRWDVVHLDCSRLLRAARGDSGTVQTTLTAALDAAWVTGGVPAYVRVGGR
jgi:hypothetical protein